MSTKLQFRNWTSIRHNDTTFQVIKQNVETTIVLNETQI